MRNSEILWESQNLYKSEKDKNVTNIVLHNSRCPFQISNDCSQMKMYLF